MPLIGGKCGKRTPPSGTSNDDPSGSPACRSLDGRWRIGNCSARSDDEQASPVPAPRRVLLCLIDARSSLQQSPAPPDMPSKEGRREVCRLAWSKWGIVPTPGEISDLVALALFSKYYLTRSVSGRARGRTCPAPLRWHCSTSSLGGPMWSTYWWSCRWGCSTPCYREVPDRYLRRQFRAKSLDRPHHGHGSLAHVPEFSRKLDREAELQICGIFFLLTHPLMASSSQPI